jgi:hypothetical protein
MRNIMADPEIKEKLDEIIKLLKEVKSQTSGIPKKIDDKTKEIRGHWDKSISDVYALVEARTE